MRTSPLVCWITPAALLLGSSAFAAESAAPRVERGDLWEVTTTMSMEGMDFAMPAQTQRVCSAKEWTKPPLGDDQRSKCETVDFRNTPTKSTWKVRCAGPPAMTGEGEISRSGPDAYKGWMKMTSSEGTMTMNLAGQRVGDCDAGEQKRQIARIEAEAAAGQKMAEDAQKQACQSAVDSMDLRLLKMQASYCTDPAVKAAFCARLDSREAFELLCPREKDPENSLPAAAAYCNRDPGAIQASGCREAKEKENLDILGKCCPAEAREVALAQCAGRKYTALAGTKYQSFCSAYARDVMAGGQNDPTPTTPETTKDKAKKTLKGLFKR